MSLRQWFAGFVLLGLFLVSCTVGSAGDDASKKKDRAQSHLIEARRLAADYKIDKAADKARDALKDNPNLAEAHVSGQQERDCKSVLPNCALNSDDLNGSDLQVAPEPESVYEQLREATERLRARVEQRRREPI